MSDKSSRTEQPTPHRIDKARKEGQFSSSREMLGAVQFLAFVFVLSRWGGPWLAEARRSTRMVLQQAFHPDLGTTAILGACRDTILGCLVPLAWLGGALVLLSIGSQLAMTRMGFSVKKLAPDIKRLNPMARLREVWHQNKWALAQALVILPLAGLAVWAIARDNLAGYLAMPLVSVEGGARLLADSLLRLLWKAASVFLVLGVVDLARERRRYTQ
ncbi:MAG TPA: EscU/YscU/HrcU family type III secretion system export apparatus switch protein, partial [Bryobacteraceae bacterium]|nr:EscU/YscU/HrcU family type III secretion system export apparatus switch protein [Bryobacteraceae bacterium]